MKKAVLSARIVLGLIYAVFGLNGFLAFLPPPELSGGAADFMGALAATGYMFPLIKLTELVSGVLLLAGVFVPLALILLAPVVVNIVLFHAVLAPEGIALGLVSLLLGVFLAWAYRDAYAPVLRSRSEPSV